MRLYCNVYTCRRQAEYNDLKKNLEKVKGLSFIKSIVFISDVEYQNGLLCFRIDKGTLGQVAAFCPMNPTLADVTMNRLTCTGNADISGLIDKETKMAHIVVQNSINSFS